MGGKTVEIGAEAGRPPGEVSGTQGGGFHHRRAVDGTRQDIGEEHSHRRHRPGQRRAGAEGALQQRRRILSIQAQLTANSYLGARIASSPAASPTSCGSREGQFVFTLGGYNPHFQEPTQFPDVPRLGFNWGLPIGATMKGEIYFALTNTCIMAGGRLELT